MNSDRAMAPEVMAERRELFHDAVVRAINCLRHPSAVEQGDHLKEYSRTNEFKVYWPRQFRQLRKVRDITDEEIMCELGSEFYPFSSPDDKPHHYLFSQKRRLVLREVSFSELTILKAIIGEYISYMTDNVKSFLMQIFCVVRIGLNSSKSLLRRRRDSDYCYVMMTNCVYPRVRHQILHVFLLDGTRNSTIASGWQAKGDDSFNLDHELALQPRDRKAVLEILESDVKFLQRMNLHQYSVLYAITIREKEAILELPGAPYGPELDVNIPIDRRDTIPMRHDLECGIYATQAQLIPIPYKNYEIVEREYYFGINDILKGGDVKDRSRGWFSFSEGNRSIGLPPENTGDAKTSQLFGDCFLNFLKNKLMPNYSLSDSDGGGSAFSSFEDP